MKNSVSNSAMPTFGLTATCLYRGTLLRTRKVRFPRGVGFGRTERTIRKEMRSKGRPFPASDDFPFIGDSSKSPVIAGLCFRLRTSGKTFDTHRLLSWESNFQRSSKFMNAAFTGILNLRTHLAASGDLREPRAILSEKGVKMGETVVPRVQSFRRGIPHESPRTGPKRTKARQDD
jgi:hypothetical protein